MLSTHRKVKLVIFSGLILFAFLFITNPFGLYFLCDDFVHVPEAAKGNFFQDHLLRPVLYISLLIDFKLWGMNATGFHVTNLVIHLANTGLVFILAKQLIRHVCFEFQNNNLIAWFSAALFLTYTFHSEPVFWIVARDSTLATFFVLLSLIFFFTDKLAGYIIALFAFTIALFTYELSWVLPILISNICLYRRFVFRKWVGVKVVVLYWLVFTAYLCLRFYFLRSGLDYGTGNIVAENYLQIVRNLAALFARLFIPPTQKSSLFVIFFLLVLLSVAFLLYKVWRKNIKHYYGLILLLLFILISLVPVLSLGIDTHDSESERFIYLASVFVCIFCAFLAGSLRLKRGLLFGSMVLLIATNLFGLFQVAQSYRYASYVARVMIEALNKVPEAKEVTFVNLPSQYKGALLFRVGFPKSSRWILQAEYDSVTILSYKEIILSQTFKTTNTLVKGANNKLVVEFKEGEIVLR